MTVQIDPEATEIKALRRHCDLRGARVLELGCGDGRLTYHYAAAARTVAGIDLHRDDLRVALIDRPADARERVQFALADAIHLPFRSRCFDLAIFAWSF